MGSERKATIAVPETMRGFGCTMSESTFERSFARGESGKVVLCVLDG